MQEDKLKQYTLQFVQRVPKYGIKRPGDTWKTIHLPLDDRAVEKHLKGELTVGTVGRWYPSIGIVDVDDRTEAEVEGIRGELGLDESNSMLCTSESKNSWHILIRPLLNEKPPTLKRLNSQFKDFCKRRGIEIYPQPARVIRLPFGKFQECVDKEYVTSTFNWSWETELDFFLKRDFFDIGDIPQGQRDLDFKPTLDKDLMPFLSPVIGGACAQTGKRFLEHGLQAPSTRHHAAFTVLYYLWRNNTPLEAAIVTAWKWINTKHNGFSKDILKYPNTVKEELFRQAYYIYRNYDVSQKYPDSTHRVHEGYITQPDIEDIIRISQGNRPRMKFLFNLVKYSYPRRYRSSINIHRDRLVGWSNEQTYLKRLEELQGQGVIQRSDSYAVGRFSKAIELKWSYRGDKDAILYEGRAVDDLDDCLRLLYQPRAFIELLIKAGAKRTTADMQTRIIYDPPGGFYLPPGQSGRVEAV